MHIVVTGDWTHPDFAVCCAGLPTDTRFVPIDGIDNIVAPPSLVVLAESRRNQFHPSDSRRWLERWPTVPAVRLLSSWCEGETRSGAPVSGWYPVLWHRWDAEFRRFGLAQAQRQASGWERQRAESVSPETKTGLLPGGRCLRLVLEARWSDEQRALEDALGFLGHVLWRPEKNIRGGSPAGKPDACVLAGDSFDPWLEARLRHARLAWRRCPKIIVMGFPRHHEMDQLRRAGGKDVRLVSKPFELYHLQHALQSDSALTTSPASTR